MTDSGARGCTPRVMLCPNPSGETGEYLTLLKAALHDQGVEVTPAPTLTSSSVKDVDASSLVVHLHWLEFLAPSSDRRWLGAAISARRAARLGTALWRLRRRGAGLVWTIHNLGPHEPMHPRLERFIAKSSVRIVDAAIVHSQHAAVKVRQRLGVLSSLVVIPHGNYIETYPPPSERRPSLRQELGIDEATFVYLSFGQIRRYKQLPRLLDAFAALPDDEIALIVAGEPRDAAEFALVRDRARRDPRVRLIARRIRAEEVAPLHAAANAAVFAYQDVFSSGSVLLALSLGLPVVAADDSTATEIAEADAIEPIGRDMGAALQAIRTGDQAQRRAAARRSAAQHSWSAVAQDTVAVYQSALAAAERRRLGKRRKERS